MKLSRRTIASIENMRPPLFWQLEKLFGEAKAADILVGVMLGKVKL